MDLALWLVYQAFDTKNYHLPSIPAKRPPKIIPAGQDLECSLESHNPNTYCLLQMGSNLPSGQPSLPISYDHALLSGPITATSCL